MIGWLRGTVLQHHPQLLLDVNGVGYVVTMGQLALSKLSVGSIQEVIIYTHVREDALELFGFITPAEKTLFTQLISVNGVGPKLAVAVLDAGPHTSLIKAVQTGDVGYLTAIPRVGKKVAQKIIIDLKSKLGGSTELNLGEAPAEHREIAEALLSLGYSERDVDRVLQKLPEDIADVSLGLKTALKLIGQQ